MRQRERESHALHTELRAGDFIFGLAVSSFLENLLQGAHFFGFFQEQSDGFFQVPESLFFAAAARGDVQFEGMGDESPAFFEDVGCELDVHAYGLIPQSKGNTLIETDVADI
jgi:hypothetical protein